MNVNGTKVKKITVIKDDVSYPCTRAKLSTGEIVFLNNFKVDFAVYDGKFKKSPNPNDYLATKVIVTVNPNDIGNNDTIKVYVKSQQEFHNMYEGILSKSQPRCEIKFEAAYTNAVNLGIFEYIELNYKDKNYKKVNKRYHRDVPYVNSVNDLRLWYTDSLVLES